MLLKSGLFLSLLFQAFQFKDLQNQGFSGLKNVKYRHFLEVSIPNEQVPSIKTAQDTHRTKRSAVFTTGVKICPQETMKGVITSHQAYYKLRVCQEAIWEAFRIFFDRVPNSEEYRAWVHTCQHENLCMDDLARNFSSSQEHLDLVARRVAELGESEGGGVATPDPGRECTWTPPLILPPTEELESEDQNMLPGEYEHIVEFSVTVVDPEYIELLIDPEDPRYHVITEQLKDQMFHILEKVLGFKEIRVLGYLWSEDVAVRYAAVFDGAIDLSQEEPGEDVSGSKLKYVVAEALSREETSLPVDIQTLRFWAETTIYRVDGMGMNPLETVASQDIASPPPTVGDSVPSHGLFPTVSITEKSTEAFTVTPETQTFVPFIPNNLPETTSGFSGETPAMAAIEFVEGNIEGAIDVTPPTEMTAEEEEGDVSRPEEEVSNVEVVKEEPQNEESLQLSPDLEPMTTVTPEANPGPSESTDPEAEVPIYTPSSEEDTIHTVVEPAILEPEVEIGAEIEDTVLPAPTESGVSNERGDEPVHSGMTMASVDIPVEYPDVQQNLGQTESRTVAEVTEPMEVDSSGSGLLSESEEQPYESTATAKRKMSTPLMMTADTNKELVVFFSLRVTNMLFSEDLFNKSSPEYRSLENTFLELILPYLESNLTGFKQLEILNFRNGSVVVNSRMKLGQPVPYNVTKAVHCVLEDFCNAASKRLDIEIDSRSLDIEPAELADPCKFLACNEFSRCVVSWTGEAECLCDSGYRTVDGQPCQSTCTLEPNFCYNGGLCEIIPGHGAACRCPVGKLWHYHGERCNERVAMPPDSSIIATSLVGCLCLVCAIVGILVFINKKCLRTKKAVTLVQTPAPYAFENTLRVNPVFENDDGVLAQTSTVQCPSSFSQSPHSETFASIENIHLSIEIPRHLYTTRSEKLVSEMVDFHQCIPHNEMWRSTNEYRASCLLRSDNDCFEVTVL